VYKTFGEIFYKNLGGYSSSEDSDPLASSFLINNFFLVDTLLPFPGLWLFSSYFKLY
jgi:hypothetical protein